MPASIEREGKVKSVNPYGFKMEGSDDYFDYSKQSEVERASKGDNVRVKISLKDEGKWWVNHLEVLDGSAPSSGSNGYHAPAGDERQQSIVRQTCLKAASEFLGRMSQTHEDVKSDHVLLLAAKFEEWVNR